MLTTPEWLKQHEGEVRQGKDGRSATVYFAGQIQYLLVPVPAQGKFSCRVSETINGKRLESSTTYPTLEDALRGGLEDLRKALGW